MLNAPLKNQNVLTPEEDKNIVAYLYQDLSAGSRSKYVDKVDWKGNDNFKV